MKQSEFERQFWSQKTDKELNRIMTENQRIYFNAPHSSSKFNKAWKLFSTAKHELNNRKAQHQVESAIAELKTKLPNLNPKLACVTSLWYDKEQVSYTLYFDEFVAMSTTHIQDIVGYLDEQLQTL
jgi:hypothetical protein